MLVLKKDKFHYFGTSYSKKYYRADRKEAEKAVVEMARAKKKALLRQLKKLEDKFGV